MPALNFQKRFVPLIQNGEKTQSIRSLGKRKFKEGDKLYLYTGQRTKSCELVGTAVVSSIQRVWFYYRDTKLIEAYIEKNACPHPLTNFGLLLLASFDGFDKDIAGFVNFFRENYGDNFAGQIICWDDFKPAKKYGNK